MKVGTFLYLQMDNYIDLNKDSWNKRVEHHLKSEFYDIKSFKNGKSSLNEIEIELLGDINGKEILHLQCHFGQDTLSLARLGAKCTGVDFSEKAIATAKNLSEEMNIPSEFICSDIYNVPEVINKKYDIVFTSYGTIGWLPDIQKWAEIISNSLKQNGRLIFVEFHPYLWMYDEEFNKIKYNYFGGSPIVEDEEGTYADKNAKLSSKTVSWNHSISKVIQSLIDSGLSIKVLKEYDYSPYNCFSNMYESEKGKFRLNSYKEKIPYIYSVLAEKV